MNDARSEQYHRRAVPYRKQQEQQLLAMGAQLRGEIEEAEAALEAAKSNDLPLSLKSCQLDAYDSEQ